MLKILSSAFISFFTLFLFALPAATPAHAEKMQSAASHAIAMHGSPKYEAEFTHFAYVNPEAPKGGTMRLSGGETFDSFNGFITKGIPAQGLGMLYLSLMEKSQDEAFSQYGALAESITTPEDRSWVKFKIRSEAKWHDGTPVTAEDVVWTFNTLIEKGRPFFKAYYAHVKSVKAIDKQTVKFTFDQAGNLELPLIVGEMTILPKHYWTQEDRDFSQTTLEPPIGSGPYKITDFEAGRKIVYERVEDWWASDLPVFKGRYNFNKITFDYYRDQNVSLEALFAGDYDFRQEYTAKLWATAYDAPPVNDGRIVKDYVENKIPQGMQAFTMNLRKPIFQDITVRKAMNYAFDYDWSNKQFAYGAYTRTRSYFQNSDMEATGLPSKEELAILEPYKDQLPPELFTQEFNPPATDGSGNNRANLRKAMKLLDDAGYEMGPDKIRIHPETGEQLKFEFLIPNINAAFERWYQPYKKNLERIGIASNIRIVDASQYINLILNYDYDLIVGSWGQSTSPGNEQREYWGSDRADIPGSRNYIGLKSDIVDALIDKIVTAQTREDLITRTRALDRVLQWGWYVVPNWHIPAWRIAYWDKFEKPAIQAPYSLGYIDTWWAKENDR